MSDFYHAVKQKSYAKFKISKLFFSFKIQQSSLYGAQYSTYCKESIIDMTGSAKPAKLMRRRFGFQASLFRSLITVRFKIQRQIRIDDFNFDLNLIKFDLFSIKIYLFKYIFY